MKPSEAVELKAQAEELYQEKRLEEAFQAYREAGFIFRQANEHDEALYCFNRAAHCEKIRARLAPLLEAANLSQLAAEEAMRLERYADAKWLFREAGLLFEKEGEFEQYSTSFIGSQDAHLAFLKDIFISGKKQQRSQRGEVAVGWRERSEAFVGWVLGLLSRAVWKYGEDPVRPLGVSWLIIFFSSIIYYHGGPVDWHGQMRTLSWPDTFYMSAVTFTTLGYGDFVPLGFSRWVAVAEAFSGLVLMPLFLIALTRRYLRVYR